jgi:hypothetical protein
VSPRVSGGASPGVNIEKFNLPAFTEKIDTALNDALGGQTMRDIVITTAKLH